MRLTKLFVLLALAGGGAAEAATLNASSCNLSAVSLVVTSAMDGDTVVIPAGTCSWSGPLSISNKSITLKGQGIGSTVIVSTHATDPLFLSWGTKPSGVSKVSDITFDSGSPTVNGYLSMIVIGGNAPSFVMQNVRLIQRRQRAITFNGYVRGVLSRVVVDTYTFSAPIHMSHQNWGGVGDNGDNSWAQDSTMGTAQALYVEDSTITCYIGSYCPATDGDAGPRYVFRFNRLTNAQSLHHGSDTPGRPRGTRQWEYYNNIIVNNAMQGVTPIAARSGTGMVFDNQLTVSGNGSSPAVLDFQTQRANQDPVVNGFFFPWNDCRVRDIVQISCSAGIATVTTASVASGQTSHGVSEGGWVQITGSSIAAYNGTKAVTSPTQYAGRSSNTFTFAASCGGTASNGGMTLRSPFDGNTNATGYPCMDQVGRGKGALISGFDSLGRFNAGVLPPTPMNQQSEPVYIWNNTLNGALSAGLAPYTDPRLSRRTGITSIRTTRTALPAAEAARQGSGVAPSLSGRRAARLVSGTGRRIRVNGIQPTALRPMVAYTSAFRRTTGRRPGCPTLSSSTRLRCGRSSLPRDVRISSPTATESQNHGGNVGVSGPLPRHCGHRPSTSCATTRGRRISGSIHL